MTNIAEDIAGWQIGPEDDKFHDDWEGAGHEWWMETFWTSFNIPERKIGGWFYNQILKNQGENGLNNGGAWVWDASDAPALYERNVKGLPMAAGPRDLRDIALPNGNHIRQIVPNMAYHMTFSDPGKFESDLRFEGIMPPNPHPAGCAPFWRGRHFDQPMHVTGEIILNGERLAVDCLSVRDRSWSPRKPRVSHAANNTDGGREARRVAPPSGEHSDVSQPLRKPFNIGYIFGTASATDAFLAYTLLIEGEEDRGDFVNTGYLLRDGICAHLVSGSRTCLVDPDTGWIWRIEFEGKDSLGRTIEAVGEQQSNHGTSTGLFHWTWNGNGKAIEGWGENQGGIAPSYPRVKRG